jgi:hypothetical protein
MRVCVDCRLAPRAVSERRAALAAAARRSLHVRRAANFGGYVCARRQVSKVWRSNQRGVSSFCPSALSD